MSKQPILDPDGTGKAAANSSSGATIDLNSFQVSRAGSVLYAALVSDGDFTENWIRWDHDGTPEDFTKIGSVINTGEAQLWRLINPTPGTKNIRASSDIAHGIFQVTCWHFINLTNPNTTPLVTDQANSDDDMDVVPTSGGVKSFAVGMLTGGVSAYGRTFTPDANVTLDLETDESTGTTTQKVAMMSKDGTGEIGLTVSASTEDWGIIGTELNAEAGGGSKARVFFCNLGERFDRIFGRIDERDGLWKPEPGILVPTLAGA